MSDINGKRGVLQRAFDILGCFGGPDPDRSVADVCAMTGLPPATVHRMLATLSEHGAIDKVGRGRYRLGSRLWRLGHGVPDIRNLRDCARPALVDLHASTRLPVALASAEGDRLHLIDKIAGRSTTAVWQQLGTPRLAEHPAGLALLAWSEDQGVRIAQETHPRFSEFAWRQHIARIRQAGFAHSATGAEYTAPLVWGAAPVFGDRPDAQVCVMLGGRRGQHPPVALGRLAKTTAQDISAALRKLSSEPSLSGTHA
ncbi:helix-turn-helix domain-containing protein [Nocardioides sp. zg-536]|uniref:Helix-turn-helix domain-containing protein n=1 Tax=Nocardioides faecalis TaxID=2803858 RepID=A0A939BZD6_9ACTN|nr:helix-turn-helix domain-containing protein [Nocardioides faecalis]MBM9461203.1 helix-turn-helix domain-containing protein [Nocardioides faecalis]MBS4752144.1 helix-turn-helix domain-containing protein [Nocardioides faecalis]QVI59051.1 helix-turn-helix domain-containing protein [Nocardioides faecalis]